MTEPAQGSPGAGSEQPGRGDGPPEGSLGGRGEPAASPGGGGDRAEAPRGGDLQGEGAAPGSRVAPSGPPPDQGPDVAPEERPYGLERVDFAGGRSALRFHGPLDLGHAARLWTEAQELIRRLPAGTQRVAIDLGDAGRVDAAAAALLVALTCQLSAAGLEAAVVHAAPPTRELLALYDGSEAPCLRGAPGREGTLTQLGRLTFGLLLEVQGFLAFLGSVLVSTLAALRRPASVAWRDLPPLMERAGADGLPIVLLINFLMGLILAFQGAVQLTRFGASVFVADLVALSVVRELGPLMTAIIVCGRSGAAFAAELGTMKVNEEVDALRTLGCDPLRWLVLPRLLALVLVVPLLAALGDLVAIAGGLFVGVLSLDISLQDYLGRTRAALALWDVASGLLKSAVFALAVGFVACQQGLAASGGALGVGRRTTSAVVSILFSIIVIDAAFTLLFYVYGL